MWGCTRLTTLVVAESQHQDATTQATNKGKNRFSPSSRLFRGNVDFPSPYIVYLGEICRQGFSLHAYIQTLLSV